MSEKKDKSSLTGSELIDEVALFERTCKIIENRKCRAASHITNETTLMFWELGQYINSIILDGKRAAYGKKILTTLSSKLVEKYGKSFAERNLYRMILFQQQP